MKKLCLFFAVLALNLKAQPNNRQLYQTDTIDMSTRIYGLSLIWHYVKSDFAYYDKLTFDWDKAYKRGLTEVCNSLFNPTTTLVSKTTELYSISVKSVGDN